VYVSTTCALAAELLLIRLLQIAMKGAAAVESIFKKEMKKRMIKASSARSFL
jgi:hypothetical protein